MKNLNMLAAILVVSIVFVLSGCGSSRDSDGTISGDDGLGTDSKTGISYVGAGTCVKCHKTLSFSEEAVAGYLESKHVVHSTFINAASGSCLECHDPIGDGGTLEKYLASADVPADGLAAVGCENCHGAGGEHYGVGPIPERNPDYSICGICHDALPNSHLPHHPLANNILTNYQQSNHADDPREGNPCFRCHSDEGFRDYIGVSFGLDADELATVIGGVPPLTTASSIQCRTCHDPHNGGMRVPEEEDSIRLDAADGSSERIHPVVFSAQFNLCTSCHQAFLTPTEIITGDGVVTDEEFHGFTYMLDDTRPVYHGTAGDPTTTSGRIIWDTHFAYDVAPADGTLEIEGYNINAAQEDACTQCHDPHAASKFDEDALGFSPVGIASEWGNTEGFHGDYLSEAFGHGCTPCHSPEGLIELTAGATVDVASTETTPIACVACHDLQAPDDDDIDGDTDTTEIVLGYLREFPNNEFTFPSGKMIDLGADDADNKLCLTCHSGRNGGSSVDTEIASEDLDDDGLADDGEYNFQNIHYRAAGASLFGNMAAGGYEFAGKSYASKFEHVDSNDLCVECHNPHSGELYLVDPGFGPTGCDNCHPAVADTGNYAVDILDVRDIRMNGSLEDYDGDGDNTEGIYYEVEDLRDRLLQAIDESGVDVLAGYPYFDNITEATQLQAAYNYQVVEKDPGSYAHNGDYIIQLLYDSLEAMAAQYNGTAGFTTITMANYVREDSGHFASDGEPFRHWDEDDAMSTSCARCHSSEGAQLAFSDGTLIQDEAITTADFKPYTRGISAGLACESCHTDPFDPAGPTRTLASVEFNSGVVVDVGNAAAFFAAGEDSPLCMSCHQGRSSTDTVNTRIAGGSLSFSNIHYYAAAASLFGNVTRGGYQYTVATSTPGAFGADPVYTGMNTFGSHPATLQTCEGCHLQEGTNEHSFTPDIGRCDDCHTGATFSALSGSPTANYQDIIDLKAQLLGILGTAGVSYLGNYPYFSGIETEAQLKAAYNWQMADKEPCGYIHNGDYIKQLLCDSIVDLSYAETGTAATPVVTRP